MSAQVLIQVLGGFRLTVGGRAVTSLPRKAQALLAYLAMQDGRPVTRETVSDLLWTDRGVEQARGSLREELRKLRRAMPGAIDDDPRMLSFVPDMVETDVGRFRVLVRGRDRVDLAEAAQTYEGGLLDRFPPVGGDFDDWLRTSRDTLNDQAIEVMRRLVDACLAAGDMHPAVLVAERMVALDLLREDSHRRLMEVYLAAGRRPDGLRQYDICEEVLRRELDVEPSEETKALRLRIQKQIYGGGLTEPAKQTSATRQSFQPDFGPPRVAVMPLAQIGSESVPAHLSDGLIEDVISQLAGLRDLRVISYGSTAGFRSSPLDIREIGHRLDARYVVRGSIRRSGSRIRIMTELADVESEQVCWSRHHDADLSISFEDQDRIVGQIVHTLAPRVVESELMRIRGKRTEDLSVYEKVLIARDHLSQLNQDNFQKAKLILDEVIAQEPTWGEAYALAADWHGLVLGEGWSLDRAYHLGEVDRLSTKALTLDRDNLRALTFYGHRRSLHHRDYDTALGLFRRALDVAPGSAITWLWSSYTHSYIGDGPEAIRRAEQALTLSPCDRSAHWYYSGLCIAHYTNGTHDAAIEWGRKALAEPIVWRSAPYWVAASLSAAGRQGEARDVVSKAQETWPRRTVSDAVAASPYRDEARRLRYGKDLTAAGMPV